MNRSVTPNSGKMNRSTSRVMDKKQRDKSMGINHKKRSSIKMAVRKIDPENEGIVFLGIKKLFQEVEADEESKYCIRMSYIGNIL